MPRSAMAFPSAAGWAPPGTKMKIDSGFRSLARWTNAEKSGFATGKRTEPMISPPAALKARWNAPFGVVTRPVVRDHRVDLPDAAP